MYKRQVVLIVILIAGTVWGCGNPGLPESAVTDHTEDFSSEEPETVQEGNSSVPWTSVATVDSRTQSMIAFGDAVPAVRDAVEKYQEEKYQEDRSFLYLQKLSVLWESEEETMLYALSLIHIWVSMMCTDVQRNLLLPAIPMPGRFAPTAGT